MLCLGIVFTVVLITIFFLRCGSCILSFFISWHSEGVWFLFHWSVFKLLLMYMYISACLHTSFWIFVFVFKKGMPKSFVSSWRWWLVLGTVFLLCHRWLRYPRQFCPTSVAVHLWFSASLYGYSSKGEGGLGSHQVPCLRGLCSWQLRRMWCTVCRSLM